MGSVLKDYSILCEIKDWRVEELAQMNMNFVRSRQCASLGEFNSKTWRMLIREIATNADRQTGVSWGEKQRKETLSVMFTSWKRWNQKPKFEPQVFFFFTSLVHTPKYLSAESDTIRFEIQSLFRVVLKVGPACNGLVTSHAGRR